MDIPATPTGQTVEPGELQRAADLLGGTRVLRREINSPLDAHDLILRGVPSRAIGQLLGKLVVISPGTSLEKAIGMSLRTFQRRKASHARPLTAEQGGRTWKFAEILAKATRVLGSQQAAEEWLEKPAIGLGQRCPIDLLATPAGVEVLEEHLGRLEYGVYA